jgi:hypothetical protein
VVGRRPAQRRPVAGRDEGVAEPVDDVGPGAVDLQDGGQVALAEGRQELDRHPHRQDARPVLAGERHGGERLHGFGTGQEVTEGDPPRLDGAPDRVGRAASALLAENRAGDGGDHLAVGPQHDVHLGRIGPVGFEGGLQPALRAGEELFGVGAVPVVAGVQPATGEGARQDGPSGEVPAQLVARRVLRVRQVCGDPTGQHQHQCDPEPEGQLLKPRHARFIGIRPADVTIYVGT